MSNSERPSTPLSLSQAAGSRFGSVHGFGGVNPAAAEWTAEPGAGVTSVYVEGRLVVYGGPVGDRVWALDMGAKEWAEVHCTGDVPPPRMHHAACCYRNRMLVHGGYLLSGPTDQVGEAAESHPLFALDIATGIWTQILTSGDAPLARAHHTATVVDDLLIVYGGKTLRQTPRSTDLEEDRRSGFYDVFVLNLQSLLWHRINRYDPSAPMLWGHSAVAFRHFILNFGGFDVAGSPPHVGIGAPGLPEATLRNVVHIWDLSRCEWRKASPHAGQPSPAPRALHAAFTAGAAVVVVGGVTFDAHGKPANVKDAWTWDISTGAWTPFDLPVAYWSGKKPVGAQLPGDGVFAIAGNQLEVHEYSDGAGWESSPCGTEGLYRPRVDEIETNPPSRAHAQHGASPLSESPVLAPYASAGRAPSEEIARESVSPAPTSQHHYHHQMQQQPQQPPPQQQQQFYPDASAFSPAQPQQAASGAPRGSYQAPPQPPPPPPPPSAPQGVTDAAQQPRYLMHPADAIHVVPAGVPGGPVFKDSFRHDPARPLSPEPPETPRIPPAHSAQRPMRMTPPRPASPHPMPAQQALDLQHAGEKQRQIAELQQAIAQMKTQISTLSQIKQGSSAIRGEPHLQALSPNRDGYGTGFHIPAKASDAPAQDAAQHHVAQLAEQLENIQQANRMALEDAYRLHEEQVEEAQKLHAERIALLVAQQQEQQDVQMELARIEGQHQQASLVKSQMELLQTQQLQLAATARAASKSPTDQSAGPKTIAMMREAIQRLQSTSRDFLRPPSNDPSPDMLRMEGALERLRASSAAITRPSTRSPSVADLKHNHLRALQQQITAINDTAREESMRPDGSPPVQQLAPAYNAHPSHQYISPYRRQSSVNDGSWR